MEIESLENGPADAPAVLVLAHGAGQHMDSDFMRVMAEGVSQHDIRVVRFNFPYMARARAEGRKRPPDREGVLLEAFRSVISGLPPDRSLFIGGKSLGGRMASLIADETAVAGLVCLGYPFHPPGRPERLRTAHLERLRTPALICQGARDPFGRKEEVSSYYLSRSIHIEWIPDGDHGFRPRKSSGRTEAGNLSLAAAAVVKFVRHHSGR
jgi:predicted alpha/beta-hydrolase family hydrolase